MIELLEQHPIGQIFPPMSAEERSQLRNDLVVNGLLFPIITYEGKVLDGWSWYKLCIEENIEPRFEEFKGAIGPTGFVIAANLHRRHLLLGQKKEIARKLMNEEPERSDRSIAKEAGLHHATVAKVREEVESNGQNIHYEPSNGQNIHYEEAGAEVGVPEETAKQVKGRVEQTGRKARGRKPLSAKEKKERAAAKAAEKAKKPKPLTSDRDERVNKLGEMIAVNPVIVTEDFVAILSGYDGVIKQKLTLAQRHELVRKFAKALGVSFE